MKGIYQRHMEREARRSFYRTSNLYERTLRTLDALAHTTGGTDANLNGDRRLKINLQTNQVYAVRCQDNRDYYRTVMVKRSELTNQLTPLISNAVYGSIPDGIPEIAPEQVSSFLNQQNRVQFLAFPHDPTRRAGERS